MASDTDRHSAQRRSRSADVPHGARPVVRNAPTMHAMQDSLAKLPWKNLRDHDPAFKYTTIQLDRNYRVRLHVDGNHHRPSMIMGLGDYSGGDLWIMPTSQCSPTPAAAEDPADTEAGAEPEAEPSAEALADALREAEHKTDFLQRPRLYRQTARMLCSASRTQGN
eukprot:gnl/TRDRNA2_/TRDRNA2_169203_c3_seq3.p1 gnl/TRDRNA2_/TRDRNA2_169203_c3~~gnl/TRDRNA2_/TRDRNA2_169203_c3_seq3.p1  ORF type:complete len:166 (+),score=11.34 gnl/TRDRNA2_/TRDRNA2_169203_c3_seq3:93-590(+)